MAKRNVMFGVIKFSIIAYIAVIVVGWAGLSDFGPLLSTSGAIIVFGMMATSYLLEA
ncbi:MAG: hypothetical protein QGI60_01540 [archaeon]|jgi:hypothetical protein|nr:hypothetical protein [archaeon]